MKPLLIAAALLLLPAAAPTAALAQVAAASMPNSFDDPAAQTPRVPARLPAAPAAPVQPVAAVVMTPANARSEDTLREIIAGAQAGSINYALMTDDLGGKMREQAGTIQPLIAGFGPVQAVDFVGAQNGADLFAVTFSNASTEWVIAFDESDKVAALLFRPAE